MEEEDWKVVDAIGLIERMNEKELSLIINKAVQLLNKKKAESPKPIINIGTKVKVVRNGLHLFNGEVTDKMRTNMKVKITESFSKWKVETIVKVHPSIVEVLE